ncbi:MULTISPECIES: HdeD family acid-resistance protein [unclassified Butyrivibrio]|uniref:HdeD family acid-resistance protein n=1 Tax=unclassified Butyrivibrio TaxID=2639466 RepID=UPI0003B5999A|nr:MULTISPECIES: DUF308 domain-containing protein [unclassified Butyrivibrio]MDC7294860.1 DUF308 domain-containing protein [Butyrivibrio sp. DSM 10294]
MEKAKKYKLHNIVQALITIAIGLVLAVWPGASVNFVTKALAVLLLLIGVVFVIAYFVRKEKSFVSSGEFVVGILVAVIGAWIFVNPGQFTDLIPKLFGVFIIVSGLGNLGQTFSLIKAKFSKWWTSLLIAVLTVGLGAFLLFNPTSAKEIAITLIGAFLIIDGVTNLLTYIMVMIAQKNKEKDEEALVTDAEVVEETVESTDIEVVDSSDSDSEE